MLGVRGQYRNIIVYEDALNETVYLTFTTALNAASTSLRSSHTLTFNPYTGILTIPTAFVTDLQCTTLEVSGLSTLHAIIGTSATLSTTLDVTGTTSLRNTLTVIGSFLTSLGGALTVTGISTFNNNVVISTNKTLTVGTGATTLGGTLAVTGATTLSSTLDVTGVYTGHSGADVVKIDPAGYIYRTYSTNQGCGIVFGNNAWFGCTYLGVLSAGGVQDIGSSAVRMGKVWTTLLNCSSTVDFLAALNVTGVTTLSAQLNANGLGVFNAGVIVATGMAVTLNGTCTLTVNGVSTFNGNVSVTGTKTLSVATGATTLGGTLNVTGTTTVNNLHVTGTYTADLPVNTLNVTNWGAFGTYVTIGTTLTVGGITTHNDNVNITGTKTLTVGGATTLSSTLGVTGIITANVGADTFKMTPSGVLYVTYSTNQGSGIIFGNNLWYGTDYLGAPATTGTTNIGSTSLRMGKIWTTLLNCSSTVDFLSGLNVTGTSALGVVTSGNQSITGTLGVTSTSTLAGVNSGNTAITGTLSVSSTSQFTGLVGIGTAPATYQLLVNNSFAVAGTSLLNGATTIGGNLTITPGYLQMYKVDSVMAVDHSTGTASSYPFCVFSYNGGTCGTITQVGLTNVVAYNTTSDYRLKQKIQPAMGCLDMVMNLKPSTYYYVGHDVPQIGLIAHECQEILPFAVNGVKDATELWCPECKLEKCDCCEKVCRPVYQGIDYGKLVPVLIGAIQDLTEIVKDLKSRLEKAGL